MPKTFGTENKSALTWIVFIAILVSYLSFPTRNYFFDGIEFSHTIESASRVNTSLIHPNHLIYNLVGYLFYRLLRLIGLDLRAVAALQIMDSILGVLSAYVLFLILRSFPRSVCFLMPNPAVFLLGYMVEVCDGRGRLYRERSFPAYQLLFDPS